MESISNLSVTVPAVSNAVPDEARGNDTVQLSRDLNAAAQAPANSSLPMSESPITSLRTNIATRSVSCVDSEEKIENAKQEMWEMIRDGVSSDHTMIMPYSFIELGEEGRKRVAKLTVAWVFTPINGSTEKWFDCLTRNEAIKEYLKDTVSEDVKNDVKSAGLRSLLGGIECYEMFSGNSSRSVTTPLASPTNIALSSVTGKDSEARVENARDEMRQVIRDGVKRCHDMIMPNSFMLLDDSEKKKVAKLTVEWVFTPVNPGSEKWFNRLIGNEQVKPYLKGTVSRNIYSQIVIISSGIVPGGKPPLWYVRERIGQLGMYRK
ncbi:hypothetical protein [Pandoraea sp. ISTKB]|uniref:hypothetical protein n=1 Tax=Pandoraea sp. ISTKB TaxID=1586708 RepID=UPI000846ABDE|nr:hypothetical protein [Pandoraea sp. ISTKB]ODP31076.1 hypothetical protein A9762_27455 [Pandoraea sp. ISTKB]